MPSDPVEKALWVFAHHANWGALHPLDDDRFYGFVVVAHKTQSPWTADDVREKLEGYGMPQKLSESLANRFWYGVCALLKSDRMEGGDDRPVY